MNGRQRKVEKGDEANIGYHDSIHVVISAVNGNPLSSMKDLVHAFENHKGEYHVIEETDGFTIALSRSEVDTKNERILKKHKISSNRSEDLVQR